MLTDTEEDNGTTFVGVGSHKRVAPEKWEVASLKRETLFFMTEREFDDKMG